MSYITLYRKYRSQTFKDLVGQEHIIRTLSNAIENDRLTHAYIFSGPRGTGKTSTARILAKSLNCREGKSVSPCNVCSTCKAITDGSSMDVIEIDAASNRGIDEMRQIREKVNYAPVEGKYKVYIIDEVHMLTEPAFNALLKTLEEPPTHTVFVLATTDQQKVPATILSRCQRLDFGRIPVQQISAHLMYIAGQEEISLEEKASIMIAGSADGGLRDAISLMDQIIAFSGSKISSDDVITIIGSYSSDFLFEITEKILVSDVAGLLDQLDDIVNKGKNIVQIVRDLTDFYRSMIFVKLGSTKSVAMSEEGIVRLSAIAAKYTLGRMKEVVTTLAKTELDMKWHPNARLLLELAFIDLTTFAQGAVSSEPEPVCPSVQIQQRPVAITPKTNAQPMPSVSDAAPSAIPAATPLSQLQQIRNTTLINAQSPAQVKVPDSAAGKAPLASKAAAFAPPALTELSLPAVKHHWSDIINKIKNKNKIKLSVYLLECEPTKVENGKVFLSFKEKYQFHKEQVAQKDNADILLEVFKSIFSSEVTLEFVVGSGQSAAQIADSEKQEQNEEVSRLVSLFDGQLL